jgi:hypothetical protein
VNIVLLQCGSDVLLKLLPSLVPDDGTLAEDPSGREGGFPVEWCYGRKGGRDEVEERDEEALRKL